VATDFIESVVSFRWGEHTKRPVYDNTVYQGSSETWRHSEGMLSRKGCRPIAVYWLTATLVRQSLHAGDGSNKEKQSRFLSIISPFKLTHQGCQDVHPAAIFILDRTHAMYPMQKSIGYPPELQRSRPVRIAHNLGRGESRTLPHSGHKPLAQ